jgi:cobalt/nickel transport system permease protein
MHISDGALSTEVMVATNAIAAVGVGYGLYKTDYERVPRVGVLASVFFVASLIHINLGPASVHLMLNGLLGFLLGWSAFPALAAALCLQSILLGFGGVTALGANVLNAALPALLCYAAFARRCRCAGSAGRATLYGVLAGGAGVVLTCVFLALSLYLSDAESYVHAIQVLLVAHLPVVAIEAVVVGAAAGFLYKVRPELLHAPSSELPLEEACSHA